MKTPDGHQLTRSLGELTLQTVTLLYRGSSVGGCPFGLLSTVLGELTGLLQIAQQSGFDGIESPGVLDDISMLARSLAVPMRPCGPCWSLRQREKWSTRPPGRQRRGRRRMNPGTLHVHAPEVLYPAQQDRCFTSFAKVCAASLSPSTILRYGKSWLARSLTVMRWWIASAAAWISSPASDATACTPSSRPVPASATILVEPRGVEICECARHVIEREGAAVGLEARVVRLLLAVAHGCDLRVGENYPRKRGEVQRRIAAGHVGRGVRAGRCGDIDELRLVGAVVDGIDIRGAGPHAGIDPDRPMRIDGDAGGFECEVLRIGRPAGDDQQALGPLFTARYPEYEFPVPVPHPTGLNLFQDFYARGANCSGPQ